MNRDDSTIWIAATDMFLCVLAVVIVAVAPTKARVDGVKPKAEYLIQLSYDVNRDVDVDLWVVGPSRKPVFYGSREVGCMGLDRDTLGYGTAKIELPDGSFVEPKENVETTTIRCIEPGHYDVAVNLYSWHTDVAKTIDFRVEMTGLNPSVRTIAAQIGTLSTSRTTINVFSFDLDRDGKLTPTSVPLEPITNQFAKPVEHPITGGEGP